MNYYDILEVNENASEEVIKMAHKALILKYHPDKYQGDKKYAEEMTQKINEAYEVLKDKDKRAEYDVKINRINNKKHQQEIQENEIQETYEKDEKTIKIKKKFICFTTMIIICISIVSVVNDYFSKNVAKEEANNNDSIVIDKNSNDETITNESTSSNLIKENIQPEQSKTNTNTIPNVTIEKPKEEKIQSKYCPGGTTINCPGATRHSCQGGKSYNCAGGKEWTCEGPTYIHCTTGTEDTMCEHGKFEAHVYEKPCNHGYTSAHSGRGQCEHGFTIAHIKHGWCEHGFMSPHTYTVECVHGWTAPHSITQSCTHGYENSHYY